MRRSARLAGRIQPNTAAGTDPCTDMVPLGSMRMHLDGVSAKGLAVFLQMASTLVPVEHQRMFSDDLKRAPDCLADLNLTSLELAVIAPSPNGELHLYRGKSANTTLVHYAGSDRHNLIVRRPKFHSTVDSSPLAVTTWSDALFTPVFFVDATGQIAVVPIGYALHVSTDKEIRISLSSCAWHAVSRAK